MAGKNSVGQSVKLYKFVKNLLWLSIVHNKQWNAYSLDITRKFSYIKDGETKEGSTTIYLNFTAAKGLVDQLLLAYQLAKNLQDNQGAGIYNIFCLIFELCYISTQVSRKQARKTRQMECSRTLPQPAPVQPGMSPTLCWTYADSLTLEQICMELGMSETELDLSMPPPPAQVQTDVLRTPESRPRKAAGCPKKTRIKSTTKVVTPILERINAPRLPNGRHQKQRPHASSEKSQSALAIPTTSSKVIAATLTNAPDATSTNLIMSSTSTTSPSSDLASVIYSTYILDQLKSNSNLEINLHKNFFHKFYYPQFILFLDNALSAQPHSYK